MTTNKKENQEHPSDVFDNNFEVIYEGDLPELPNDLGNDDYKDVLSNLSELDTTSSVGIDYLEQNRTKSFVNPDTPQSRHSQSTGSPNLRIKRNTASLFLQAATLLLIAIVAGLLAVNFWNHDADYADIASSISSHNYILGAYYGMSLFLLLIEWITFLNVLSGSGHAKGNGMFSFLLIYLGSILSHQFAGQVPSSPVFLLGIRKALIVYGSLNHTLFILCSIGVIICVIRRFQLKRR